MMNTLLTSIRLFTAVLMPISAVTLSWLTRRIATQNTSNMLADQQACRQCGQIRQGADGQFTYTESIGSPRQRVKKKESFLPEAKILGSETHFVCDPCALGYLRNEMRLHILMVLAYPVYLFVIIPYFVNNGLLTNFLVEAFMALLAVAGTASAYELYQAIRAGDSPLGEARDRVAIRTRKSALGKGFSYFTRTGMRYLKKSDGSPDDR